MLSRLKNFMGCSPKDFVALAASAGGGEQQQTCSGRGDCLNGTCLCEIRYSGDACTGINLPYHAGECWRLEKIKQIRVGEIQTKSR